MTALGLPDPSGLRYVLPPCKTTYIICIFPRAAALAIFGNVLPLAEHVGLEPYRPISKACKLRL